MTIQKPLIEDGNINISFPMKLVGIDERQQKIADSFGLGYAENVFHVYKNFNLRYDKQIYYITGDSGSGKSLLLKHLKERVYQKEYVDFNDIEIDSEEKLYTICEKLEDSLKYLALVGLGDAFLFLNKYGHLSDGQRARYRLLKCLLSGKKVIIIDEFLATLDRESAFVVSYNLQRTLRTSFKDVKIFVATTHRDLFDYLRPDIYIEKLYGTAVRYIVNKDVSSENPFLKECTFEFNKADGLKLWKDKYAIFHYRSHSIPFVKDIAILKFKGEDIGIIVFKFATNKKCETARISRVVILPKYRGVGLSSWFVGESSRLFLKTNLDFKAVDSIAIMANFNPFFEKAGFKNQEYQAVVMTNELHEDLVSKKVDFFRFRCDYKYAFEILKQNPEIEAKLLKIYEKRRRMYMSFDPTKADQEITLENIDGYLQYLEIIHPKKYILTREDYEKELLNDGTN